MRCSRAHEEGARGGGGRCERPLESEHGLYLKGSAFSPEITSLCDTSSWYDDSSSHSVEPASGVCCCYHVNERTEKAAGASRRWPSGTPSAKLIGQEQQFGISALMPTAARTGVEFEQPGPPSRHVQPRAFVREARVSCMLTQAFPPLLPPNPPPSDAVRFRITHRNQLLRYAIPRSTPQTGFWMSDKPLVQQALAQELADLVLLVPRAEPSASTATPPRPACAAALEFLEGFWDSMIREWPGLDKWR